MSDPLFPVTVSVKGPLGPDDDVFTLSVDALVVGERVNVTVEPDGWPLRLRITDPENPLDGVTVTVYVAVLPRRTETEAGLTESEKSADRPVTVTLAEPLTLPLVAVTVNGPPAVEPAVNRPAALIVPPPPTDQVNAGGGLIGWPNWSRPVAPKCARPSIATEAVAGDTLIVVSTGLRP